jgi:hypothetical protein
MAEPARQPYSWEQWNKEVNQKLARFGKKCLYTPGLRLWYGRGFQTGRRAGDYQDYIKHRAESGQ